MISYLGFWDSSAPYQYLFLFDGWYKANLSRIKAHLLHSPLFFRISGISRSKRLSFTSGFGLCLFLLAKWKSCSKPKFLACTRIAHGQHFMFSFSVRVFQSGTGVVNANFMMILVRLKILIYKFKFRASVFFVRLARIVGTCPTLFCVTNSMKSIPSWHQSMCNIVGICYCIDVEVKRELYWMSLRQSFSPWGFILNCSAKRVMNGKKYSTLVLMFCDCTISNFGFQLKFFNAWEPNGSTKLVLNKTYVSSILEELCCWYMTDTWHSILACHW